MKQVQSSKSPPRPGSPVQLPPHPAMLDDRDLLNECDVRFGRASGPGGQHRNKVETAVRIVHKPTGIEANAAERRQQTVNRAVALKRLRLKLACEFRRSPESSTAGNRGKRVFRDHYQPSELWQSRRQGKQISINPDHRDYPALLAEAMDVITARGFDVAGAAGLLGVTMSQLAKLVRHSKRAFALVNEGRVSRGLPALK